MTNGSVKWSATAATSRISGETSPSARTIPPASGRIRGVGAPAAEANRAPSSRNVSGSAVGTCHARPHAAGVAPAATRARAKSGR